MYFLSVSFLTKSGLLSTPLNGTDFSLLQKVWFNYFTFKILKIVPFLILPFCEVQVDLGVAKLLYYNSNATFNNNSISVLLVLFITKKLYWLL